MADCEGRGASARSFFEGDGQVPVDAEGIKNIGQWIAFAVGQQIFGIAGMRGIQ